MISLEKVSSYKKLFRETCSYISVEDSVLESAIKAVPEKFVDNEELFLDYIKDYILSQGLEEEVEY